jgi:hypothetical protein
MTGTTDTKDFGNPVQVNTSKLFIRRLSKCDKERKMREKTAHIGLVASFASQGRKFSK